MKAVLCKELGPPSNLVVEDITLPSPGPKEVRVQVKACSVNYPDTLMIQGLYQFRPELPFSPGGDFAGIVTEVGAEVKHLKSGDEVFGASSIGCFAEEANVPSNMVFPKPPSMDFKTAASFMMAYGTSYHALKDRARLKEGETLAILGASGGVGMAALELGKLMGAKVIACASTDEKLELCKKLGADEVVNYTTENLKERIKELTGGKGADVVYDPVGGDYTEAALRATAWEGRFLIIGFPAGIAKIPMNLPLLKGCEIVGVFWGKYAQTSPGENMKNTMEMIKWHGEGKLKPHIDREYSLDEAHQALDDMMNRRVKGKVVVVP